MKIEDLKFPVTLEAFAAYQEERLGLELGGNVRKAMDAWLPVINAAYADGCYEDSAALQKDLAMMDDMISGSVGPVLQRLLRSCRWWIAYAWGCGRRDAEKAVAV